MKGKKEIAKKNSVLEKLVIEYVAPTALKPNSYNPNRQSEHDFELLCRSMKEDGFTQPIIVQQDGTIVDGEHRWRAAQALGYTQVPVVRVSMTPEQMRISTLRHNRARGSEDIDLTAAVLRDLRRLGALDWAQDSLMMDDVEMQKLLEDVNAPAGLAAEQFTEAWRPGQGGDNQEAGSMRSDSTLEASNAMRAMESRIAAAKTSEDRAAALRDADIFRLTVTFSGEEAKLVKQVLGATPAQTVLELCRLRASKEA